VPKIYGLLDGNSAVRLAEVHTFSESGPAYSEKLVIYRRLPHEGSDSKKVALKKASLEQEPHEVLRQDLSGRLQSYRSSDPTTGEFLEIRVDGGKAKVSYRSGGKESPNRYELAWGESALVGAEIADFVRRHWAQLIQGKTLKFELFVPFKKGFFTFQVDPPGAQDFKKAAKELRDGPSQKASIEPDSLVSIRVVASSWMMRPFAPAIAFTFSCPNPPGCAKDVPNLDPNSNLNDKTGAKPSPVLVSYFGPSPIELRGERYPLVKLDLSRQIGTQTSH
jgi:hypothetical protein